jgi:signal transduction histidine kinase
MRRSSGFRSLGRLLVPLLLIVCVLSGGLGWLAWRVIEQDRALESQRILDRLGTGADLAGSALLRRLVEVEDLLSQIEAAPEPQWPERASRVTGSPAGDAVVVVFRQERIDAFPATLPYYPITPRSEEAPSDLFAPGEALEFRQKDNVGAIAFFRNAARSVDPAIRAGALVRLARTLRKANEQPNALAAYDQLADLVSVRVGDVPVDLIGRHARCVLLQELQRVQQLRSEATALCADLRHGRWQITEGIYRFYLDETRRWLGADSSAGAAEQDALAASISSLWSDWQNAVRRGENTSGRRSAWVDERPVLLVWRGATDRLTALVAAPRFLERQWLSSLQPTLERLNLQLALADANGHPVFEAPAGRVAFRVVRSSAETDLPWTLHVSSANLGADIAQISARRRFVLAGFALMVALIAAASYVTARAVARELAVARLQSDFVSAVSHEFRTPLASLRQLSELLADGRVASEQRRQQYYEDLRHESERLHRLVENLLDFGRMEAGAREYHFEAADASALARSVAEEFAREVAERGYRVEITTDESLPTIRADREALARALWNLLDNAVKYSPNAKTVWIDARGETGRVMFSVRDQGLGIAPEEQRRIYNKFVRGASATAAGIKGTGLGLAMAQHIVAAHGGEIRVMSEPGRGSTFTVVLPVST